MNPTPAMPRKPAMLLPFGAGIQLGKARAVVADLWRTMAAAEHRSVDPLAAALRAHRRIPPEIVTAAYLSFLHNSELA